MFRELLKKLLSLVLLVQATPSAAKSHCRPPTWFIGPETVRDGDHLTIYCSAEAIVDEVAEFKAKQSCDNAAAAEVMIRAIASRPARPATEVGPPADMAPPLCIVGIECDSPRTRTCRDDTVSRVWRRCSYNLEGAHEGSKRECPQPPVLEEPTPEPPAPVPETPPAPVPETPPAPVPETPPAPVPETPPAPLPETPPAVPPVAN